MKLIISYEEVKKIILGYYELNNTDEVIIRRKPVTKKKIDNIEYQKALSVISQIELFCYRDDEKIEAIKKYRQLTNETLTNSKWAIENFNRVKSFIYTNQRLPKFSGDYNSGVIMS